MRTFIVILVIIGLLALWIAVMPTEFADIYNKKEPLYAEEKEESR